MQHFFQNIQESPIDPIFGLASALKADQRSNKVNLLVGLYKKEGRPYLMPSVQSASQICVEETVHREYLPIGGDPEFCEQVSSLVLQQKIAGIQTLGGTGALFASALLLKDQKVKKIIIPSPTWPNHLRIFSDVGIELQLCPMKDDNNELSYRGLFSLLQECSDQWILLDACCHNPTGVDMTPSQWQDLANICKQRGHKVIFDMAYLGFGRGVDEDAQSVRLFHRCGVESLLCFSCSKNFTLYGERVGALFPLGINDEKTLSRLLARLRHLVRAVYSSPASFGSSVVKRVLSDPDRKKQWLEQLDQARSDLKEKRALLVEALNATRAETLMDMAKRLSEQKGLFAYMGLDDSLVERLRVEEGIYLVGGGRINLSALTQEATERLVGFLSK